MRDRQWKVADGSIRADMTCLTEPCVTHGVYRSLSEQCKMQQALIPATWCMGKSLCSPLNVETRVKQCWTLLWTQEELSHASCWPAFQALP